MLTISQDDVDRLHKSGEFDPDWYLSQYPDVAASGMDPAVHYLWLGARIGRKGIGADARVLKSGGSRRVAEPISRELRKAIADSGLFDEAFYREAYGDDLLVPEDLLYDYINSYYIGQVRDPNGIFSTRYYSELHPDVVDMHPFVHYVMHGEHEGRAAFSPEKINAFLGDSADKAVPAIEQILPKGRRINIIYWEGGNFFLTDVAHYTKLILNKRGYEAEIFTDLPGRERSDALNLVVAPHEYCACGPGKHWTEDQYRQAAYISTEQWHTSWFVLSLKYLRLTEVGILDLNPSAAAGLTRMGMPSAFLPLLPIPGSCFDIPTEPLDSGFTHFKYVKPLTYPEALMSRPYDVALVAVLNDRRAKALAELAPALSRYDSFIHCPRFTRPVKAGDPDMLSVRGFAQIARNSKVLLNIHQGESHYLEWQRMFLMGMMEGAIVLSEPCTPNSIVRPGEHYLECSVRHMPDMLDFILRTPEGQAMAARIHDNNVMIRKDIAMGRGLFE